MVAGSNDCVDRIDLSNCDDDAAVMEMWHKRVRHVVTLCHATIDGAFQCIAIMYVRTSLPKEELVGWLGELRQRRSMIERLARAVDIVLVDPTSVNKQRLWQCLGATIDELSPLMRAGLAIAVHRELIKFDRAFERGIRGTLDAVAAINPE